MSENSHLTTRERERDRLGEGEAQREKQITDLLRSNRSYRIKLTDSIMVI
jgi:hypothetical protein